MVFVWLFLPKVLSPPSRWRAPANKGHPTKNKKRQRSK